MVLKKRMPLKVFLSNSIHLVTKIERGLIMLRKRQKMSILHIFLFEVSKKDPLAICVATFGKPDLIINF